MMRFPTFFALSVALVSVLVLGSAAPAQAAPNPGARSRLMLKAGWPKFDLSKLAPKVTFKPKAKLKGGTAKVSLKAVIQVAGKSFTVPIFDMGLKKTKKTMTVKRKMGKLSVSLKISWSGTRTITIRGTARYLKFKVPVPKIKLKV